jgi:hypothetical protein
MRRTLAWWAGLFALVACLALVLVMLRSEGGLLTAANVAQLVSIPLAAAPLARRS